MIQNLAHRVHTKEESFKEAANEFKRAQFMMNSDGLRQLRYKLVNTSLTRFGLMLIFVTAKLDYIGRPP